MVKCCKDCYPCCDFCLYVKHHYAIVNEEKVKIAVEGCKKHSDEHHQSMARGLGYCKDFHCFKMEEKENGT